MIDCRHAPLARRSLLGLAALAGLGLAPARAQDLVLRSAPAGDAATLRFGALPVGGAVEWRRHWAVLLEAQEASFARPVNSVAVGSEESLESAVARNQLDLALLPGTLALDAVLSGHMRVVAQVQADASGAPRALLLTRAGHPAQSLDRLLADAGRWRIARGDRRSLTGFVVPQVQLLLPRGLEIEVAFRDEQVGSHQGNALDLANGEVDLATNDSVHFACFTQQFPAEAGRLQVAWQSSPTPPPFVLVREDWSQQWKERVRDFFVDCGRRSQALALRDALYALQMPRGFAPADNSALLPVARLTMDMARQRAQAARWVHEDARLRRLERLERTHAHQVGLLQGPASQ